jgi:uncharacterized protein (TIGR02145 family)
MKTWTFILGTSVLAGVLLMSCNKTSDKTSDKKLPLKAVLNAAGTEVTIGTQVWMTRNLNVVMFRNGDTIPEVKSAEDWIKAAKNKQPAWCYYNNDSVNELKYGKLYNWYAVSDSRGLAPKGWHVPSDDEWTKLTDYIGGMEQAGLKLKAKEGWAEVKVGEGAEASYYTGNGNNMFYFSAIPAGLRSNTGLFTAAGEITCWWTSTSGPLQNAWSRSVLGFDDMLRFLPVKDDGYSVRCLKD